MDRAQVQNMSRDNRKALFEMKKAELVALNQADSKLNEAQILIVRHCPVDDPRIIGLKAIRRANDRVIHGVAAEIDILGEYIQEASDAT